MTHPIGAQLVTVRAHAGRVLARRAFYDCVAGVLDLAYIGGGPIALGPLIECWNAGELQRDCESCGGVVFIHRVAGSPLSGTCSLSGWCEACGHAASGPSSPKSSFADLWRPVRPRIIDWVRDPHRSRLAPPLRAVVSMLEGAEGLESVTARGETLTFDWSRLALCCDGRTLLRLDGSIVRDPSGFERFTVEGDTLLTTDGAPLFMTRNDAAPRSRRIEEMLKGACGAPEPRRPCLVSPDGRVLFRRTADGLVSAEGELVVRCSPELPDALAGIVALSLHEIG